MLFWDIFWPVFSAILASFTITELYNVLLGYYIHIKQERMRKELEAKVASGEIDPISLMTGGFPPSGMNFPLPTAASGEVGTPEGSHGQYL